jgi:hypothetical protein
LLEFGARTFHTFNDYYTFLMNRYFRRMPPIPTHIYLNPDAMEDINLRIQVARLCRYPSIINILANDDNEQVRQAARENEFWTLIGRYQDIMGFGKRERLEFARTEVKYNLLVMLIFEDDLDVLSTLLHNPAVSLKMLALYSQLLEERGRGRKDAQIFEICRQVLQQKKDEIMKISTLKNAAKDLTNPANVEISLHAFIDADHTVMQAASNILSQQDATIIRKFVYISLDSKLFSSILDQFSVLTELYRFISRRDDLRKISINTLALDQKTLKRGKYRNIADFFISMINRKRRLIVQICAENLTNFDHIIVLTLCQVDSDAELRMLASETIPVDEIINLVNEVSTPRKVFRDILAILERHSDEAIVEMANNAHLRESQRLKESLKEMEIRVQAYFDIIFQSVGYRQIYEYQNVIKSLQAAETQLSKFETLLQSQFGKERQTLKELQRQMQVYFRKEASHIYFDTTPKTMQELEHIAGMIEEIFDLKQMGLDSLRPGTPEDIESEIKSRARIIWQSAISSYLGRIKDLTEMISKKMAKIAIEQVGSLPIELDIEDAIDELEVAFKQKIQCKLAIPCAVCSRRGCAAERFLGEAHFLLRELLDNFSTVQVKETHLPLTILE